MIKPGIYSHICPITNQIRYIGRSTNWPKRASRHLNPSTLQKEDSHHYRWIKQLISKGLKPKIQLIQEFPTTISNQDLNKAEIYWISYFKTIGSPLTNETLGGEGHPITDTTKLKIKAKLLKPNVLRSKSGRITKSKQLSHDQLISAQSQSKPIVDNYNNEYLSIKDASRKLSIPFQKISDILHGRKRSYKGYTFRYK